MTFGWWRPLFAHATADAGGAGGTGTGTGEELETETEDLETDGDAGGEGADDAAAKAAADKAAADAKAKADADAKAKAEKGKKAPPTEKPKKGLLAGAADEKGAKAKDDQAGGAKGAKGKDGDQGDELAAWAPKLPEGQKADEELVGELKGWAKERSLKGEDLQRVVDLGVKMQAKVSQAFLEAHEGLVSKYEAEAKADKEIGGAKLEGTLRNGLAVLKHFAGADYDAVISELERTGLGSHRAILATLNRIHAATLKEDDTATRARSAGAGAGPIDSKTALGRALYPKMQKQLSGEDDE